MLKKFLKRYEKLEVHTDFAYYENEVGEIAYSETFEISVKGITVISYNNLYIGKEPCYSRLQFEKKVDFDNFEWTETGCGNGTVRFKDLEKTIDNYIKRMDENLEKYLENVVD